MTAREKSQIVIVSARPAWTAEFETLKWLVLAAAPPEAVAHHIGSTAVPGLAAKDVIDIQLTVASLDDVCDASLQKIGFRRKFGLSDHSPLGPHLDEKELAKRFYNYAGRAANLHVREAGRFNQRYALLCRDYLRTHEVAAKAYALVKHRLAETSPDDADAYYAIKDPVFDIIMDGASEWAQRTGWHLPPPD